MRNYYVPGSWNVTCDRCGFQYKNHEMREEWTGLMVCHACCESRHPQDLLRVFPEDPSVPWTRPEPTDVFTGVGDPILDEDENIIFAEDSTVIITETE